MTELNLALPGNPRYQPKFLEQILGYDTLYKYYVLVELAALDVLGETHLIPAEDYALLTEDVRQSLFGITTTMVDEVERKVTKHDIRALVQVMQARMPEPLRRWVHVPLTSYDVIDTARALMFKHAFKQGLALRLGRILQIFAAHCDKHAETIMIGRTHGQHAVPITAGFWFATVLSRLIDSVLALKSAANGLVGKITGPVGAYNGQVALGYYRPGDNGMTFEEMVMKKLGLVAAPVSTQIVPPEPLARYLFACHQVIAALGQFGTDARQLMRSEIGELSEPFAAGQVGSSTMAHKRNPITFEGLVGAWQDSIAEFMKVLLTSVSEHQRDLTGSSVMRDFPTMVVILGRQIEPLLREDSEGRPFLERITIDVEACRRNFEQSGHLIMAEPLYLAIQQYGFVGDAHELVNHGAVPLATERHCSLVAALNIMAVVEGSPADLAFRGIPGEVLRKLNCPGRYIGRAPGIARETAVRAREAAESL